MSNGSPKSAFILGVILVFLFAMTAVVTPFRAEARCANQNDPKTTTLEWGGVVRVVEVPETSTCNGNNTYSASVRSTVAGWRASVWIQNNGNWVRYGDAGYTTNPSWYSYHDDNSHSYFMLCADNGMNVGCGYGTAVAFGTYGSWPSNYIVVNQGF
jgi:hypothetical protein